MLGVPWLVAHLSNFLLRLHVAVFPLCLCVLPSHKDTSYIGFNPNPVWSHPSYIRSISMKGHIWGSRWTWIWRDTIQPTTCKTRRTCKTKMRGGHRVKKTTPGHREPCLPRYEKSMSSSRSWRKAGVAVERGCLYQRKSLGDSRNQEAHALPGQDRRYTLRGWRQYLNTVLGTAALDITIKVTLWLKDRAVWALEDHLTHT